MKKKKGVLGRKILDNSMIVLSVCAISCGILFLFWILITVFKRGFVAINADFFTKISVDGAEGGVINALLGTLIITVVATVISVPIGLLGGVFLCEYGGSSRINKIIRFSANVMMGMPSIIVGLFVYSLIVIYTKTFSGFAGSLALSIIMLPIILRTTEDMLCLVPNSLREAALALGTPRWKTTIYIVFRGAKSGLLTGVLLAIARVSGETAPLLFTALNSYFWPCEPWWKIGSFFTEPMANLTVTINDYAMSPFEGLNKIAWGAALLISVIVLFINLTVRTLFKEAKK